MKPKVAVGVAVIIAALGYIIYDGLRVGAAYYLTVSEFKARTDLSPARGIRLHGIVDPASITYSAESRVLSFRMIEGNDTLRVRYRGIRPDQLAEAQEAVLEGRLGDEGVFEASKIMLKCPSKYEAKRSEDAM